MGGAQSRSRNTLIVETSAVISQSTTTIMNNSVSVSAAGFNRNQFRIIAGRDVIGVKATQSINSDVVAKGKIKNDQKSKLTQELNAGLTAAIDQAAESQAGFMATGSSDSSNYSKLKNSLSVVLTDTNIANSYDEAVATVINENAGEIIAGRDIKDVELDQSIVAKLVVEATIDNIFDKINEQLATQDTDIEVKQKSKATSLGVESLAPSFMSFSVASVICFVVVMVVILLIAQSDAGQDAIRSASNRNFK